MLRLINTQLGLFNTCATLTAFNMESYHFWFAGTPGLMSAKTETGPRGVEVDG